MRLGLLLPIIASVIMVLAFSMLAWELQWLVCIDLAQTVDITVQLTPHNKIEPPVPNHMHQ